MHREFEDDLSLRAALRGLPQRDPPADAWDRIQDSLASMRAAPPRHSRRLLHIAVAACVAFGAAAALFIGTDAARLDDVSAVTASPSPRTAPPAAPQPPIELAALLAESARLERTLVALPRHDGVVRVGTASTIAGLEDHIAWIDAELSASEAFNVDPVYRQALWQERVEMMTALIDVQYAQLPATMLVH